METQEDSKIKYLLRVVSEMMLDGRDEGYEYDDKIAKHIWSLDTEKVPGVRVKTLDIEKHYNKETGSWREYQVLYEIDKYKDNSDYLSHVFKCLGKIINSFSHLDICSMGIQEVDCSYSNYYYVLIYILSDGKEEIKKEDYFSDGGRKCIRNES